MAEYKRSTLIADSQSGYCPGCLHSLATRLISDVIEEMGEADNSLNVISVGCSALNILYWGGDFLSVAHGHLIGAAVLVEGGVHSHHDVVVLLVRHIGASRPAELLAAHDRANHLDGAECGALP